MEMKTESQLIKTVTNWAQGRDVLASFIAMHPELGMRYTENVYNNFVRIHGPALLRMDVMRKANLRAPAIMNLEKFDQAAFDILSRSRFLVENHHSGDQP